MLTTLQNLVVVLFVVATMLSTGVQTTSNNILSSFSNYGLIVRSVILNIVIVPLIGYLLYRIFNLPTGLAIGLIIVITVPGSPFGLKLAELAGGDLAYATALLLTLSVLAIVTTPIVAQVLLPGEARASFNLIGVIAQLILLSLLPLLVGLQLRQRNTVLATRVLLIARRTSTISLILVFIFVLAANLPKFAELDAATILVMIVSCLSSFGLGFWLAKKTPGFRQSLALSTGMRNFGLALLIAQSSFPGTAADVSVVAYALISFLLFAVPVALWNKQSLPQSLPIQA